LFFGILGAEMHHVSESAPLETELERPNKNGKRTVTTGPAEQFSQTIHCELLVLNR